MKTVFSGRIDDAEFRMFQGLGVNISACDGSYYLSFDKVDGKERVLLKKFGDKDKVLFAGRLGDNDIWCCEEQSYADFLNDADNKSYHVWMDMDSRQLKIKEGAFGNDDEEED